MLFIGLFHPDLIGKLNLYTHGKCYLKEALIFLFRFCIKAKMKDKNKARLLLPTINNIDPSFYTYSKITHPFPLPRGESHLLAPYSFYLNRHGYFIQSNTIKYCKPKVEKENVTTSFFSLFLSKETKKAAFYSKTALCF